MKKTLIALTLLFSTYTLAGQGTLILAHGSMNGCGYDNPTAWEAEIHKIVDRVRPTVDQEIQVAFGMWNTKCFQKGLELLKDRMEAKGLELEKLNVLPLFVSSHSLVIQMQKYIFKKLRAKPIPIPQVTQIKFNGTINYMSALDYNPHLSMVMANRVHELIHKAKELNFSKNEMEVVFTMHGPVGDEDNEKWLAMAKKYVQDLEYLFPVGKYHILSLRDDADADTRDRQTQKLRSIAKNASDSGKVALILPFLLSKGGIQSGILKRLEGLDYIWTGNAILPDHFFDHVLKSKIQSQN